MERGSDLRFSPPQLNGRKTNLERKKSGNETDKSGTYPGVVPIALYIIWYKVLIIYFEMEC